MSSESRKKGRIVRAVIALILIAGLLLSLIWTDKINRKLGLVPAADSAQNEQQTPDTGAVTELGDDLNVHFVDVRQGDACIIEFPDDKKMLIDAGENNKTDKTALINYIEENIKDAEGNSITYFDYVVLTHPDSDHCGGMFDVLKEYPAKTFYRPNVYYNDKDKDGNPKIGFDDPETEIKELGSKNIKDAQTYGRALQAAYEGNVEGTPTEVIVTDATNEQTSVIEPDLEKDDAEYYSFTFYAPIGSKSYSDWNDYSPIMLLEYHEKRFMLSGDAEKNAEADFVAEAMKGEGKYAIFDDEFSVDVFKLGHHGSRTSSSEAFINVMTTPESCADVQAIISCGADNKYGHPHEEVLERLKKLGFKDENILRTDTLEEGVGAIAMSVRGTKADDGSVSYALYVGENAVRNRPKEKVTVNIWLTWFEIVIIGCVVVIIVLLVMPEIRAWFKKLRGKR